LQFKESVHRFAQEHIAPHAARIDSSNYFPKVRTYLPLAGVPPAEAVGSPFGFRSSLIRLVRACVQEVNLWKLMGDFNLHGLTSPGTTLPSFSITAFWNAVSVCPMLVKGID
jgi:isovaleryl-CoA dehydrogenase